MTQKIKAPFSIGTTSRMTIVTQKQIRYWEDRGYIPAAMRVVCGERAYRYCTSDQVEIIRIIKDYIDQGYTLKHASKMATNKKWRNQP